MSLLKPEWLFPCRMDRVICHWTVTDYQYSDHAADHYHFLIDGEGRVHKGYWDIDDNVNAGDGAAASHTYRLNSGSIGVACLCMGGATASNFGRYPLREIQWQRMAEVVAELCAFYKIPITPKTVLQHGEVDTRYVAPGEWPRGYYDQGGKWDINVLPWARHLTKEQVWDDFRERVTRAGFNTVLAAPRAPELHRLKIDWHPRAKLARIFLDGKEFPGCHVALQIVDGVVTAAKVTMPDGKTLALDPSRIPAGSLQLAYEDP